MQFKPAAARRDALRLEEKLHVGHHDRTCSAICLTTVGAHLGFAVKRLDEAARWQKAGLIDVKGLPWEMKPPTEKQPGATLRAPPRPAGPREPSQAEVPPPPVAPGARARYVTNADVERQGSADFCPGSISVAVHGSAKVTHNNTCRERMGMLMAEDTIGRGRERLRRTVGGDCSSLRSGCRDAARGPPAQAKDQRTPEPDDRALERVHAGMRVNAMQVRAGPEAVVEPVAHKPRFTGVSKRSAGISTEVLEDETNKTGGRVDADVVLSEPVEQSAETESTVPDVSIDSDTGSASMLLRVCSAFEALEEELEEADLMEIAALVAELNGVDVSEVYLPARFSGFFQCRFGGSWPRRSSVGLEHARRRGGR